MDLVRALGRCLAAFGLSGSEYASAEELVNALITKVQIVKALINQFQLRMRLKSKQLKQS
jgi:hypothetical protein